MSALRILQAASIFYLDNLFGDRFCTRNQLLLVVLATFFYIDIFSNHYFLDLSYSTPSSKLWGKPCTVSSASHSPSLLEPVPIQPSLTWSHSVSFRLHYSPACASSQFSTSSTFSPRKGPWQFPCPVLAGLKVRVYKVKFAIRKFCLEVTATRKLLSSAPATPCHITGGENTSTKLSPLQA